MSMKKIKLHKINTGIITSCVVGFALSYYAYMVETAKEQDHTYEAMCDISEHVSCTKAFMSEYGKGFGIIEKNSIFYQPNSVYGIGYYGIVIITSIFNDYGHAVALMTLAIVSNISSIYLAWILYLLNDICVICVSTYVVNGIILIFSYQKLRLVTQTRNVTSQPITKKKLH
ncbi:hypothetical protein PV325_005015 [Microctonus aethiopoides]|uniref:vitamin-K-epoxide reductase (warfarin-sensitive) n=1 Tax=Microctonus aethiopoides TaxID=144406 RepID=A0AA39FKJ3_9HYME|nr:hypothetical protein PV325_005015 [Microctonus aethiopoides]KAK0091504.1 hypothetical protein PV326_003109 [Microctonus aethiopoides]KAK0171178.1 hypothetical protein PV328_008931 [Microctonus aethiopoides]